MAHCFFAATDEFAGRQLWKSDGTADGTVRLSDGFTSIGGFKEAFVNVDGTLFFVARTVEQGTELWKSDGTKEGTVLVKDITIDVWDPSSYPRDLTSFDGSLFFGVTRNNRGIELWKSDGTEVGTVLVTEFGDHTFAGGEFGLRRLQVAGDTLFAVAKTESYGEELYAFPAENSNPPNPPAEPPGDIPRVRIEYENKEPASRSREIRGTIEIYNDESTPQNFEGVEIRYSMNPDGLTPLVSVDASNAISQMDSGFDDDGYAYFQLTDEFVVRPGKRLKVRFTISNSEKNRFDQTNDPSFTSGVEVVWRSDPIEPPNEPPLVPPPSEPPVDPPPNADPAVQVVYENKEEDKLSRKIRGSIEVYNRESTSQNFHGLEIRYAMDPDGLTPIISIDAMNAPDGAITSGYQDGYVYFRIDQDFVVNANRRLKLRFTITNVEQNRFDQSNDTGRVNLAWSDLSVDRVFSNQALLDDVV